MNNKLDFVYRYLRYLAQWNKSASLLSIIQSIENHDEFSDDQITEFYHIAQYEYSDTIALLDNREILSLPEMYSLILVKNRDEKINEILND